MAGDLGVGRVLAQGADEGGGESVQHGHMLRAAHRRAATGGQPAGNKDGHAAASWPVTGLPQLRAGRPITADEAADFLADSE
ncbi:hypothetical protein MANAM107_01610 [Actinomyces capricornis]|uniref:Uncharacterized protein n=1 Tax=Actinomyces capricornis TaxID=2755559 RepID=A0ABM7U714_9ACTO|nr:hypothetical protein MANAM107_01610 [Actinomyces capricornis]